LQQEKKTNSPDLLKRKRWFQKDKSQSSLSKSLLQNPNLLETGKISVLLKESILLRNDAPKALQRVTLLRRNERHCPKKNEKSSKSNNTFCQPT